MIDTKRISELQAELGSECFAEVAALFMADLESALGTIDPARADAVAQFHLVKGLALNLGFRDFAQLCSRIEAKDASAEDINALNRLYSTSKDALLPYLKSGDEGA